MSFRTPKRLNTTSTEPESCEATESLIAPPFDLPTDTRFVLKLFQVLIILYSAFGTVACLYGYGRDDLDPAGEAETSFWRMVAQTFAMTATATSKSSVGFFLLRLIAKPWHKVVIWSAMGYMVVASICAF